MVFFSGFVWLHFFCLFEGVGEDGGGVGVCGGCCVEGGVCSCQSS